MVGKSKSLFQVYTKDLEVSDEYEISLEIIGPS